MQYYGGLMEFYTSMLPQLMQKKREDEDAAKLARMNYLEATYGVNSANMDNVKYRNWDNIAKQFGVDTKNAKKVQAANEYRKLMSEYYNDPTYLEAAPKSNANFWARQAQVGNYNATLADPNASNTTLRQYRQIKNEPSSTPNLAEIAKNARKSKRDKEDEIKKLLSRY